MVMGERRRRGRREVWGGSREGERGWRRGRARMEGGECRGRRRGPGVEGGKE